MNETTQLNYLLRRLTFIAVLFLLNMTTSCTLFAQTDTLLPFFDSIAAIKVDSINHFDSLYLMHVTDSFSKKQMLTSTTEYRIEGSIKDFTTGEPLSFASVAIVGTSKGVKADENGMFVLFANDFPKDSILISIIGYAKKYIYIPIEKKKQNLQISMERSSIVMKDFVLKASRNPALALIKKVIKNKYKHDKDRLENYSYEVYNKLEMDINKIPKRAFVVSPIIKEFSFIQNYIDSTSEDKPFLPLFLSETISDYYYQRKPQKTKEYIKGSRISGYKNQSVSQLLGSMYQNINIYDNSIPIFSVAFISPIANNAPLFYTYHLTDTQVIQGKTYFQVAFASKRGGEHTFNGDLWIEDEDFAIQKATMIVTKEQNINWVNKINLMQEYTCMDDTLWVLTKDKFYVDFLPPQGDKFAGILGRRTTTYRNFNYNQSGISDSVNSKQFKSDITIDENALSRKEEFWNDNRHESLSKNEKAIYQMMDTIQQMPVYKKFQTIFYFLGTGIREVGYFELGSFYNIFSRNPIEGNRFRLNIGTTTKLSKHLYLRAYGAYGTLDNRFKYYGSALWILKKHPRRFLYGEWKHDIDNAINTFDNVNSMDNIFNAIARKPSIPWKLAFTNRGRLEYYNSYFNGFSTLFSIERRAFVPYAPLPTKEIIESNQAHETNAFIHNEIGIQLRYAHREQFIEGNYYRTSLGSKLPIFTFYAGLGIKNILTSDYSFTKFRFTITDHVKLPPFGTVHYQLFAGKTFGTLPYPLLEIHPGNEFYYYNPSNFNLMYRYEYLSDTYTGAFVEHSMGSSFFKYIPLIKKMKVRSFWNAKFLIGSLQESNMNLNLNTGYPFQHLANKPYMELGTGVENIFKVLRLDLVWRALPHQREFETSARRIGLFGSFKLAF
jgi:hypothetical protein